MNLESLDMMEVSEGREGMHSALAMGACVISGEGKMPLSKSLLAMR